jgi:tRNA (guanine37-N1)-methyltransferase
MKEWHETVKTIEIKEKPSYGHQRKRARLPASPQTFPIPRMVSHFVMNLPATAVQFLGIVWRKLANVDAFRGIYREEQHLFQPTTDVALPMIHAYCFQSPSTPENIVTDVRQALGYEINEKDLTIHNVRNVSPNKVTLNPVPLIPGHVLLHI